MLLNIDLCSSLYEVGNLKKQGGWEANSLEEMGIVGEI